MIIYKTPFFPHQSRNTGKDFFFFQRISYYLDIPVIFPIQQDDNENGAVNQRKKNYIKSKYNIKIY